MNVRGMWACVDSSSFLHAPSNTFLLLIGQPCLSAATDANQTGYRPMSAIAPAVLQYSANPGWGKGAQQPFRLRRQDPEGWLFAKVKVPQELVLIFSRLFSTEIKWLHSVLWPLKSLGCNTSPPLACHSSAF